MKRTLKNEFIISFNIQDGRNISMRPLMDAISGQNAKMYSKRSHTYHHHHNVKRFQLKQPDDQPWLQKISKWLPQDISM